MFVLKRTKQTLFAFHQRPISLRHILFPHQSKDPRRSKHIRRSSSYPPVESLNSRIHVNQRTCKRTQKDIRQRIRRIRSFYFIHHRAFLSIAGMSALSPSSRRRVVLFARDGAASPMPSASVPSLSSSPSPPPKGGYVPAKADLSSGSANRGTGNTMVRGEERRSLSPAEKAQRLRQSIADAAARGVSARGRWEGESDASTFSDDSQPSSQSSSSSSTSLPRDSRRGRPAATEGRFNNNSSTNISKKDDVNAYNADKAVASASRNASSNRSNAHPAAHNSASRPLPLDTDITALLVARSRTTTAGGTAGLSSNRRRGDRRTEEVPSSRRAGDCNSAVNTHRREESVLASSSQQRYRRDRQNVPDEFRPSAGTYNQRARQSSRRGSPSSPSSPSSDSRANAPHHEYASGDCGRRREHNAHSDEEAHDDDGGGMGMRKEHSYSEEAHAMARCIGDVSAAVGAVERELRAARRKGRAARRQSAAATAATAAFTSTRTNNHGAHAKRYRSERRSASPPSADVARGHRLYPHAYASPPAARRGASPSLGLVHSDSEGADRKHAYLPHGENPTSQPRRRRRTSSAQSDHRHHRGASSHAARPSSVSSHSSSSSSSSSPSPSTGRHRRYNSHRRSSREEATRRRGERNERSNERQHASNLDHYHHHGRRLRQRDAHDALFRDRLLRSEVEEVGSGRGREGALRKGDSKHLMRKNTMEASGEAYGEEEDVDSSAAYAPLYSAETLRLVALEQRMTSLALRLSANAYLRGDRSRSVSQSRSRSHSERAAAEGGAAAAVGPVADRDSREGAHQWHHQRDDAGQSTSTEAATRGGGKDGHLTAPNVNKTLGAFEGAGGRGAARRISLTPTKAYSSGDDDEEGSKIGDDDSDDRPRLRSPATAMGRQGDAARRHPAVVAAASAGEGATSHHGAHVIIEMQRKRDGEANLERPAVNERSRVVSVGDESALSSASFCASLGESSDRRRDAWRRQRERLSALTAILAEATADDAVAKRQHQQQLQQASLEEGERAGGSLLTEEKKGPLSQQESERIGLGPTYRLAPPPSEAVGHRYAPPDAVQRSGGGYGWNDAGPSSTRYSAAAAAQPSPPVVSLVSRALSASQQRSVSERSRGTHDNDGHHYARASDAQQWGVVHEQSYPNDNDSHRNECRTSADTSAAGSSVYCGQAPLPTTAAPPPHHRQQQRRSFVNDDAHPEGSHAAYSETGPSSHHRRVSMKHHRDVAHDEEAAWEVRNVPRRFVADRSVLGSAAGATSRYSHMPSSSSPPPPPSSSQRRQKRADAWEPSGFGGVAAAAEPNDCWGSAYRGARDGGHSSSLPTPIPTPTSQQWGVSGGVRGGVGEWTEAAPPPFADGPSPAATSMFASPPPRTGAGGVYGGGTTYSGARNGRSEERNKQQHLSGGAHRSHRADSFECVPPPPSAAAIGVHHSQYAHSPSSSTAAAAATTRVLFSRGNNAAANATAVSGGFDGAGAGGGDEPSLYVDPTLGSQWHAAAPSAVEEEGHRRQHQQQWSSAVASPPPLSPMTP